MRKETTFAALMVIGTLLLAACGTPSATAPAPTQAVSPAVAPAATEMTATSAPTADSMGAMNHGAMGTNAPYDALFIDSMIMHHQGAITMAQQALKEAEHPEIKTLATAIVQAQEAEITQMQAWRKTWYPDVAPTEGMGMDMGTMMIAADASTPFDLRFIEAMIPHHQGAIAMAKDAQQKAERPEIKALAGGIITAQEAEIAQMQQWKQAWFAK